MLAKSVVEDVLTTALSTGGDFAEVFAEDRISTGLLLQNGIVEKENSGRDAGVGIRVFNGLQSVYAYTTDFSKEGLLKAAKNAAFAIQGGAKGTIAPLEQEAVLSMHPIRMMP